MRRRGGSFAAPLVPGRRAVHEVGYPSVDTRGRGAMSVAVAGCGGSSGAASSGNDMALTLYSSGDGVQAPGVIPRVGEQRGAAMGELARTLQRAHASEADTLTAVTTAALTKVPGAEHAAISLVLNRTAVQARAATGSLPQRMEELQAELGEGPCLAAVFEQETVHIANMASESRWPAFEAAAAAAGVGSMLCFRLFVGSDNLGALNLYASNPDSFDAESTSTGLVFASHAAVAIAGARQERTLTAALANRDIIGQAKGILMERFHLDAVAAFTLIAKLSQEQNIKLRDIAAAIVADVTHSDSAG